MGTVRLVCDRWEIRKDPGSQLFFSPGGCQAVESCRKAANLWNLWIWVPNHVFESTNQQIEWQVFRIWQHALVTKSEPIQAKCRGPQDGVGNENYISKTNTLLHWGNILHPAKTPEKCASKKSFILPISTWRIHQKKNDINFEIRWNSI